jgi:hypothetical protein
MFTSSPTPYPLSTRIVRKLLLASLGHLLLFLAGLASGPALARMATPPGGCVLLSPADTDLGRFTARLQDLAPASMPIVVVAAPLLEQGLLGRTHWSVLWYTIEVDPRLTPLEQMLVLQHEWAHVLSMEEGSRESHGWDWGRNYALLHRLLVGQD